MVRLTIDGNPLEVAEDTLLIDALSAAGKAILHVCHGKRLVPSGACHLCLVEVEGQRWQVVSCTAEVAEGMVVQTHSHALDTLCRTNLELITARYPRTACAVDPKHPFRRLLVRHDVPSGGKHEDGFFKDDSRPYLGVDMERCAHYDRCMRICEKVQGQFTRETIGRDDTTHITTSEGPTLLTVGCVSCGAYVDSCASGTLFDKRSGVKPTA